MTVVGEVSGGGAHPTSFFPLNNGIAVLMPNRRSYNPVTNANWEAIGVIPEIITERELVVKIAHELAKKTAKVYREESFTELKVHFSSKFYTGEQQERVTRHYSPTLKIG